ncbi:TPA: hypothetical protein ACKQIA_003063, partial [Pseudomonas aeruginosa]
MKMKKSLVMSTVLLMASNFACADEGSNDGSEICRAQGGVEITSLGEVSKGVDVEDVVVCSILPSNMKSSQRAPTLPPLQRMIISAMPSPGTVTVSAGGDRKFTTSCRANLYAPRYANFYPDGVSRGTSDLRCVGYNTPGNSSQGCNVSWVGPTDIQLGVEPYGGSVVVNYSCTAFKTTIPVIMS